MTEFTHKSIVDGWFREANESSFPGQAFTLKVEKILYHAHSEFQDILVFKSTTYGNVLVLDGIIQCTERDEFAYQEMITHIPLYLHKNPKRILVIGGGDGGVVRELLKHECLTHITQVEIDETVIKLARKYFPGMSHGLDNPRVQIKLCDGFEYLKGLANTSAEDKYDVIITDSSDPEGPAEAFFKDTYFKLLKNALKDNDSLIITQTSENIWLNIDYLQDLLKAAKSVFPNTKYCYTMVPTYTSGQLGLMVCSPDETLELTSPVRIPTEVEQDNLKYYNAEIHKASFVLPNWSNKLLNNSH
ncbi:similar to Saccharomyces cerevisiae YLR146C SPE4 Spermine synthase, required for the biosynthesis of spermine and also involved in biosynthesis of pantothenic acid [Maudiozyma barnettii]|uniref:Similar to Saccharomyces cerevisiae YLR146C SPE4 Spermine synthase, required for the biosynthesis of spermine and also involved in biosynthesis of pantothenic acid n=1 Tax=Maudiozyma barnettii TaxID=61262 RepID=A0A8H2VFZ6_9SACH|nr:spermine synthase [Kazachstania barnettii]CAB4254806.1 similar to Saccharomyces cerevisiae YLR146C SPE4 Spermine synthase, required for the biosynthesis of spermine and also involved in biosynthesis of pantothenic acid [Kazachstania barnettii]CAD1782973.1 similar to Saccharomyces cerevisiae YLR146C SPE4 Spermine synthase, required for the biosynthesis of spermine and also involved in biosynthesis of pantothenic acid [Kazachstania barnettii]